MGAFNEKSLVSFGVCPGCLLKFPQHHQTFPLCFIILQGRGQSTGEDICESLNLKMSLGSMPPDPLGAALPGRCVGLQLYHNLVTPLSYLCPQSVH